MSETNTNNIYIELPYYLNTNTYRPEFKISRRKILQHSNIDNYLILLEKSNLENTFFYTDNIQTIIKNSLKLGK